MEQQITVKKRHPQWEAFVIINGGKKYSDENKSENFVFICDDFVFVCDGSAEMMMCVTNLCQDGVPISFIASGLDAITRLNSCSITSTLCCGGPTHTLTTHEGRFVQILRSASPLLAVYSTCRRSNRESKKNLHFETNNLSAKGHFPLIRSYVELCMSIYSKQCKAHCRWPAQAQTIIQ